MTFSHQVRWTNVPYALKSMIVRIRGLTCNVSTIFIFPACWSGRREVQHVQYAIRSLYLRKKPKERARVFNLPRAMAPCRKRSPFSLDSANKILHHLQFWRSICSFHSICEHGINHVFYFVMVTFFPLWNTIKKKGNKKVDHLSNQ